MPLTRILPPTLMLLLSASLSFPAVGDDDNDHPGHNRRQLGTHTHGVAELNVAVDADILLVELNSPAMNLVGFEHPPETDEQRAGVETARRQLQDGAALFVPNPEAECVQMSSMVTLELATHERQAGPKQDHEQAHADGQGEWAFTCAKPVSLDRLDVRLFEVFTRTERLRVQLITSAGRRGLELTPENHQLNL